MFQGIRSSGSLSAEAVSNIKEYGRPLAALFSLRPHSFLSLPERKERFQSSKKRKRAVQNRKCKPYRHRVRRSQLHSVSAGAAKTPYPQPSSSFPNCDRFTGSQFGHLEFYNAARYLDDGGQTAFCEYVPKARMILSKMQPPEFLLELRGFFAQYIAAAMVLCARA